MAVNPKSKDSTKTNWVPYIVAIVILIIFCLFVNYMFGLTKAEETEWTRAVYLFSGVEAIAFAAAGFLFGKEVHRAEAEKADKRADQAEADAAAAEKVAANGKILAETTKAITKMSQGGVGAAKHITAPSAGQAGLKELRDLADKLFP